MAGKIKVEWNSKAVMQALKEMTEFEEERAAKRVWAWAIKNVPIGKITRIPKGNAKEWAKRIPGTLLKSIKIFKSRFKEGGQLVWAGNTFLVYYAHFVEFGTVFMTKRRGERFMRKAILRERRNFYKQLENNLKD